MPRKRGPKLQAAKRKPSGGRKNGSVVAWNKREDIPMDEIDEFHNSRDKVLLNGMNDQEESEEEEEVFALQGLEDEDEEESEDNGDFFEGEEDGDMEQEEQSKSRKSKGKAEKTKRQKATKNQPPESDEDTRTDEEELDESWGKKKSVYYSSNAAQIDSDDDEAHDMEEQEALRIQAKLREGLKEQDFGLDAALQVSMDSTKEFDDILKPTEPTAAAVPKDRASVVRHLLKTNPEALALVQEWDDIASQVVTNQKKLEDSNWLKSKSPSALGLIHMHHQALLTYASVLAFYFYLRASGKYSQRPELLRSHPITKRLLTLKQSLSIMESLDYAMSGSESEDEDEEPEEVGSDDEMPDDYESWLLSKARAAGDDQLEEVLLRLQGKDEKLSIKLDPKKAKSKQGSEKSKESKKEKQKVAKPVFDVEEPSFVKPRPGSSKVVADSADAFGEATALDFVDATEKNVRRKALRFHTAKIESASARRANARNALGGDDDIPYRERKKQQEQRALEKAKKNALAGGDDLDDVDPEVEKSSRKRQREEVAESGSEGGSESDNDGGYYSLVQKQKKAKKAEKKARYEEEKAANMVDYGDEDEEGGQRSVTRAILKNKGLTPKRSKSVRNPRVKKRMKFEKAKKKLASQKPIYKGPADIYKYDGERSGITKVVKSVKL